MNILMALSHSNTAASEVYTIALSEELIKKGNNVYIISDNLTKVTKVNHIKVDFTKSGFFEKRSQLKQLVKIIKENNIHVIHAHTESILKICAAACKKTNIPLITTINESMQESLINNKVNLFGDVYLAVCENIRELLIKNAKIKYENTILLRNAINVRRPDLNRITKGVNDTKFISIVGNLAGTKEEVFYSIINLLYRRNDLKLTVIGGKNIPDKFKKFVGRVEFLGYVPDIRKKICESDMLITGGRAAIEGILSGVPVFAIGELETIGTITSEKIDKALKTNFGDASLSSIPLLTWNGIVHELNKALEMKNEDLKKLKDQVSVEFSAVNIAKIAENIYQKQIVEKMHYEMPILKYSKITENKNDLKDGSISIDKLETHLKYLKKHGYETITFTDFINNKYLKRFDKNKKMIILAFVETCKTTYKYIYPLLKKYEFKGIVYVSDNMKYPKNLVLEYEIEEMKNIGIEFASYLNYDASDLKKIEHKALESEINNNINNVEKLTNKETLSIYYETNDLRIKKFIKKLGYSFALTQDTENIVLSDDKLELNCIKIESKDSMSKFRKKISGSYNLK